MSLSASESAQGLVCAKLCAIGCLQVVYAESNEAKSLVKGTNSLLKAVVPALMKTVSK